VKGVTLGIKFGNEAELFELLLLLALTDNFALPELVMLSNELTDKDWTAINIDSETLSSEQNESPFVVPAISDSLFLKLSVTYLLISSKLK